MEHSQSFDGFTTPMVVVAQTISKVITFSLQLLTVHVTKLLEICIQQNLDKFYKRTCM